MEEEMSTTKNPGQLGRSILALVAGFVAVVVLSIGTDAVMIEMGVFPKLGDPMTDNLLLLATAYRTIDGVVGSYITARVAPYRPMFHALLGGLIGLVLSTAGAVGTWNQSVAIGHHWYPFALIATVMPTAWAGGKIRETQLSGRAEA